MTMPDRQPKLIHVRQPLKRVNLQFQPVVPPNGPTTDGPLIHVRQPLKHIAVQFEPVATAYVELTLPLAAGADGEGMYEKLNSLVAKLNEMEALFQRAGVFVDSTRSGVQSAEVVIVLAPNDPTDAVDTCKRIADSLFAVARKVPGITVKVFTAAQPETPVYELAA